MAAAVRCIAGNSCGTGAVVGRDANGSFILTNAHVVGTRVGREVRVDTQNHGTKQGRVIMAAYSDRTLSDWAIVYVEGFRDIEPVNLSKKRPTGSHYTMGCPRCVWPPRNTDIATVDIDDDSPLWRWNPNAIGGQSGSGVWSDTDNLQYGLLTWSWGGKGAGQMTAEIYRQARNQTVAGAPRIEGLEELPAQDYSECEFDLEGEPPTVENGFFAQAGITELPIWAEDVKPPTPDPENPDATRQLMVEFCRAQAEFYAEWQTRFMTEPERKGPNNGTDSSGGSLFGM